MPIAFFTRTQTGALQSRLNNDVVGAQQAVTTTLGTVLQNVIQLAVTLDDHVQARAGASRCSRCSRCPRSSIPRVASGRVSRSSRATGMQQNAEMNNITAERFNVAGAMLAKLFGRPDRERDAFAARAGQVRDVGITTAIYSRILLVALGPRHRDRHRDRVLGRRQPRGLGHDLGRHTRRVRRCTSTQIYQPLAQLTNSRVDVLTALVSFERVFEVLDFPASITDRPGAVDLVDPKGRIELDHVWFRHPAGPRGVARVAGSAGNARRATSPATGRCATSRSSIEPGATVALVGASGAGKTTIAMLVPRVYDAVEGAVRIDGHDVRDLTLESVHAAIGLVPQDPHLFHDTIRANLRVRARRTRPTPSCDRRSSGRASGTSSRRSPTASTPSSANAATACRAARSNASRSRASC